jgi:hypothetical protein
MPTSRKDKTQLQGVEENTKKAAAQAFARIALN